MIAKKFFLVRFRKFFIIMLIPSIIICSLYFLLLVYRSNNDLMVQGTNTLSSINTNFDVVIREAVYQQSLMTNSSKFMLPLKKVLQKNGNYDYSDKAFLEDLETTLRSIVYSHSYIDSIYLYLDGQNNFMTENGITSLANYYDTGWYITYVTEKSTRNQWINKRKVNEYSYAPAQNILTVYRRMASTNGVIVINIDIKKLINIFNSIATDNNESIFLLDENYSMILGNQENLEPQKYLEDNYFRTYLLDQNRKIISIKNKWIHIGNKFYLLNYEYYDQYYIYAVSLISVNAFMPLISNFIIIFLLILFFSSLIILILSYITTNRIFSQIEYMIQVFGDAEQGIITEKPRKRLDDEYDIIMNNVIHQFLKTSQMKEQLTDRQHQLEVAELKALQLQINPHFLVNTLQTIDLEAAKLLSGPSSISNMIHNLCDILKYALKSSIEPISLREELIYLKEYVSIQRYRFGNKFIVYYEINEGLMDCQVLRLMLQPLIENSISHGVRSLEHMGYIKLKAFRKADYIHFCVIDNGVGLSREELTSLNLKINDLNSRNIGLTNVNKRLILKYGKDCGLYLRSRKGLGTSVSFKVPLSKSINIVRNDTFH